MVNPVAFQLNPIKVAVSGHRELIDSAELHQYIEEAILFLRRKHPTGNFRIFSCMAEGADLLLTKLLIAGLDAELVVVLPLPLEEYKKDFSSLTYLILFDQLLRMANEIVLPVPNTNRPECYEVANRKLMLNVDALVVIWDGLPSRGLGGTGSVVDQAREQKIPIFWIQLRNGLSSNLIKENFG